MWYVLIQVSEYHEDGIKSVVGPFDNQVEANMYMMDNVNHETRFAYAVPGMRPRIPQEDVVKIESCNRLDAMTDVTITYHDGWDVTYCSALPGKYFY